jgi:tetratricopeptide (TPR) repeat protein
MSLHETAAAAKRAGKQAREWLAIDEGAMPSVPRPPAADDELVIEDNGADAVPVRAPRRSAPRAGGGGCRASMTAMRVRDLPPGAALARGWCLMGLKRPVEAAAAFEVAQQRGSGQVASDATYGRTLALLAAGLTADAAVAAAGGNLPTARRNELTASLTTQRALTAYREGRYEDALINLDERARILPEQTDLMVVRGWSYFHLGRYGDAEQVFNAVMRTGTNPDAARGLIVIKQKTGRLPE